MCADVCIEAPVCSLLPHFITGPLRPVAARFFSSSKARLDVQGHLRACLLRSWSALQRLCSRANTQSWTVQMLPGRHSSEGMRATSPWSPTYTATNREDQRLQMSLRCQDTVSVAVAVAVAAIATGRKVTIQRSLVCCFRRWYGLTGLASVTDGDMDNCQQGVPVSSNKHLEQVAAEGTPMSSAWLQRQRFAVRDASKAGAYGRQAHVTYVCTCV